MLLASGGVLLAVPAVSLAQSAAASSPAREKATLPREIPPLPKPPVTVTFEEQLAGRKRLYAARDAARQSAAVSYRVESVNLTVRDGKPVGKPLQISETGKLEPINNRIAITTEYHSAPITQIRRAIASDGVLLTTRYVAREGDKKPPVREAGRVAVDSVMPLERAVAVSGFRPNAIVARWVIEEDLPQLGYSLIWRSDASTVLEYSRSSDERRKRTTVAARRYTMDPQNNRLIRFEEWQQTEEPADKENTRRRTQTEYEQTVYTAWNPVEKPFPAETFAQTLPATYEFKEVPRQDRTLPPIPTDADPRALALLERWRQVDNRWLSLRLEAEQQFRMIPRTEASRPIREEYSNVLTRFSVQAQRHGKTRLQVNRLQGGSDRDPKNLVVVSDGSTLRALNQVTGDVRSRNIDNPDRLWREIDRARVEDYGALRWIYDDPPRPYEFEQIAYEGPAMTPEGEKVEVVRLVELDVERSRRRRRTTEEQEFTRIAFGSDGLPRWIEQVRREDIQGAFERDNPPIIAVLTRFRNVSVDLPPTQTAFQLPALPSPQPATENSRRRD
ncbi:MAG: hypothetical protein OHK0029_37010 [Armatimonadaceae bacterium]